MKRRPMTVLGTAVKANRTRLGMSLQALADAAGISKNHVWDIERGHATNPTIKTINDLALAFDMEPGTVAGWAIADHRISAAVRTAHR